MWGGADGRKAMLSATCSHVQTEIRLYSIVGSWSAEVQSKTLAKQFWAAKVGLCIVCLGPMALVGVGCFIP